MKKLFLLISLFTLLAVSGIVYADDLNFSNVTFVNDDGTLIQNYPNVGDEVYATVTVDNISEEEKDVLLVAGCYEQGRMTEIFISKAEVGTGESTTLSTKIDINSAGLEVVANCLTLSDLKRACISPSNLLADSTDISYISVNGKRLEDFSNSENS